MAKVVVAYQNVNLSTANGFYRAEAYNLGGWSLADLILSSTRTISVTFANAGNCQGIILSLVESVYNIGKSVTVKLKESGVERASVTLTADQITNSAANKRSNNWHIPFVFASPYAVDTTAGKWTFEITQSGSTGDWYIRTSNGTVPFYITWCDNSVSFASGDTVIAATGVVTIDQTCTFGPTALGTGETYRALCALACRSTTPTPNNVAMFVWENPPSSAYTLTIDGCFVVSAHSGFRAGTLASPISAANMATMLFSQTPTLGTAYSGFCSFERTTTVNGYLNDYNATRKASLMLYGAYPANRVTFLSSGISPGVTSLTSDDATGWVNGDTFVLGKTIQRGEIDKTTYTVTSTSGTTINFSPALAGNARLAGGLIIKTNGYGVRLAITGGTYVIHPVWIHNNASNLHLYGTLFDNGITIGGSSDIALDDDANMEQSFVKYCHIQNTAAASGFFCYNGAPIKGLLFQYNTVYLKSLWSNMYFNAYTDNNQGANGAIAIRNNYFLMGSVCSGSQIPSNNYALQDNIFQHLNASFWYFSTINVTITGNRFWGCGYFYGSLWFVTVLKGDFNNNYFDCCTAGLYMTVASDVENVLASNYFGTEYVNVVDIGCIPCSYFNQVLKDPMFGSGDDPVISDTIMNLADPTSWLRLVDVNGTLNDCRSWTRRGKFVSTSGKIKGYTIRTDETLENTYKFSTQEVTGFKIYLSVTCQIENADYYAGVHTLPFLTAYYDAGTTSSPDSATADTGAQTLSLIITPTSDYNDIKAILSQATDAATADSGVTWDTLVTNLRAYGYQFQDHTTTIFQTLDSVQAALLTPVVNLFITVTNAATVGAYTGITIDHDTQTITIDEAHTLAEVYDYSQWDLCQDANMGVAEWLTTIDGINLVSAYDVVVDTGVALTGGGSVDVGENTFTNNGTYDGIIITTTDRKVHAKILGIVSGSRYYVSKISDGAEILNTVAAGDTDDILSYTVDIPVNVMIRQYGYLEVLTATNISETGFYLPVAQAVDPSISTPGATVDGWTGYSITWGAVNKDIGDGEGSKPYSIVIDCNNQPLSEVYEWVQRQMEKDADIDDGAGTHVGIATANLCSKPGSQMITAIGVWLDNVPTADALNYIVYDDNGDPHQVPVPPVQLEGTGIADGSRIQVYDVTGATELDNDIVSGTSYTYEYDGSLVGHTLRIRLTYASGASYKKEWTTQVVAGAAGCSFLADQQDWDAVNAWSIDGSAVTEFTADYPNVQVDADDGDGETTKTRFGAWWAYNLSTENGIRYFFGGLDIPAANVIKVLTDSVNLQIQNVAATSLVFTDSDVRLYRDDSSPIVASGTGSIEIDYNGVPDVVYISTGSGLSEEEHDQLMSLKSAYAWKRTA